MVPDMAVDDTSFVLGMINAFAEMTARNLKPLGLGPPLEPARCDEMLPLAQQIADAHGVQLYVERDFIETLLFDSSVVEGKVVFLLYRDRVVLDRYLRLKHLASGLGEGCEDVSREEIARQFGSLLGYPTDEVNGMISERMCR